MFYILAVLLVVVLLSVKSTKLFGVILLAVLCMVYPRVFITLILLAVAGYLYLRLGNLWGNPLENTQKPWRKMGCGVEENYQHPSSFCNHCEAVCSHSHAAPDYPNPASLRPIRARFALSTILHYCTYFRLTSQAEPLPVPSCMAPAASGSTPAMLTPWPFFLSTKEETTMTNHSTWNTQ